jgi:hypothetical protein
MQTQTENQKEKVEKCFTLGEVRGDVKLSDGLREVLNTIARVLIRNFDTRMDICLGNSVKLYLYQDYVRYVDICQVACEEAVEALGSGNKEGVVSTCYDKCYRRMKEEAFITLYENYRLIRHELNSYGIRYTLQLENVHFPTSLVIEIKE